MKSVKAKKKTIVLQRDYIDFAGTSMHAARNLIFFGKPTIHHHSLHSLHKTQFNASIIITITDNNSHNCNENHTGQPLNEKFHSHLGFH